MLHGSEMATDFYSERFSKTKGCYSMVPDRVLNFTHLIGKPEFGHAPLANVIALCSLLQWHSVFRRTAKEKFRI